uniref:Uncharacterized protein n=1 Tax=Glossina palpalis gambiensis TaxID=67801 RepID=A0A1B0AKY3_9MUSC
CYVVRLGYIVLATCLEDGAEARFFPGCSAELRQLLLIPLNIFVIFAMLIDRSFLLSPNALFMLS